jgi:hypothetical protein
VVGEQSEICLAETTENGRILDENTLPAGLEAEVRREKVRVPDGRDGVWVADEIRRERAGQPAPDEPELDEADKDRETYYLYLTGKPKQAGEYLFVLWDGTIKLCSVTVLTERPEPTAAPVQPEQPTQSEQPAQQEPIVEETWVDFGQQDTTPTNPPAPAFILPDPSVSITGAATVQRGRVSDWRPWSQTPIIPAISGLCGTDRRGRPSAEKPAAALRILPPPPDRLTPEKPMTAHRTIPPLHRQAAAEKQAAALQTLTVRQDSFSFGKNAFSDLPAGPAR